MADSSVNTGVAGAPMRVLTGLGAATADQEVMSVADPTGNLLVPVCEDTGQQIVRELRKITMQLAQLTGVWPSDTDVVF